MKKAESLYRWREHSGKVWCLTTTEKFLVILEYTLPPCLSNGIGPNGPSVNWEHAKAVGMCLLGGCVTSNTACYACNQFFPEL